MPRKANISKPELIRWQKKLHTDKAIGEEFGITGPAIRWNRKKYGIPLLPGAILRVPTPPRIPKDELIKLQKKLHTDEAIGKKFGITKQRVHQLRNKYGIPAEFGWRLQNPPRIPKDKLLKLQKTLKTDKAIGKKYGISRTTVSFIRKRFGIPTIALDNTKRNNKIVALYKKGATAKSIGNDFGLTAIWVYTIIRKAGAGRSKLMKKMLAKKVKRF